MWSESWAGVTFPQCGCHGIFSKFPRSCIGVSEVTLMFLSDIFFPPEEIQALVHLQSVFLICILLSLLCSWTNHFPLMKNQAMCLCLETKDWSWCLWSTWSSQIQRWCVNSTFSREPSQTCRKWSMEWKTFFLPRTTWVFITLLADHINWFCVFRSYHLLWE